MLLKQFSYHSKLITCSDLLDPYIYAIGFMLQAMNIAYCQLCRLILTWI